MGPAIDWAERQFRPVHYANTEELTNLQLRFRLNPPLAQQDMLADLVRRCRNDDEFALDVLDYTLYHIRNLGEDIASPASRALPLARVLILGGSAWGVDEVADQEGRSFRLARRAVGPVPDAVVALSPATRAPMLISSKRGIEAPAAIQTPPVRIARPCQSGRGGSEARRASEE